MRGFVIALTLAGCGFTAPGGQQQPVDATTSDGPGQDRPAPDGPAPDGPMADAALDAPVGPQCPAGYAAIPTLLGSTSQYRFVSTQVAWIDAERDCEDDGDSSNLPTHLIVLDDTAERDAMIAGPLGVGGPINDQWIGLTDLEEEDESFNWVTNQQATLALAPGGDAANRDCVRIKNNAAAEARDCTETNRYVCECDASPAVPGNFPNLPNGNQD
jgi:hypothetical protein